MEVKHMKFQAMLPPAPDKCQECAVKHLPQEPHNRQSLFYQMSFHLKHERFPTWADAIAHCSDEVKAKAEEYLRGVGMWE